MDHICYFNIGSEALNRAKMFASFFKHRGGPERAEEKGGKRSNSLVESNEEVGAFLS